MQQTERTARTMFMDPGDRVRAELERELVAEASATRRAPEDGVEMHTLIPRSGATGVEMHTLIPSPERI